jgi:hypothetical protein
VFRRFPGNRYLRKGHARKRSASHSSATVHRKRKIIGQSATHAVGILFLVCMMADSIANARVLMLVTARPAEEVEASTPRCDSQTVIAVGRGKGYACSLGTIKSREQRRSENKSKL